MPLSKHEIKEVLGKIPFLPQFTWLVIGKQKPLSKKFSLESLKSQIPQWKREAKQVFAWMESGNKPRRIVLVSAYKLWLQHSALLSVALACLGNNVHLVFLPYTNWRKKMNLFDLQIQNAYAKKVLNHLRPLVKIDSLLDWMRKTDDQTLSPALQYAIRKVSERDTQYTLQIEHFDPGNLQSAAGQLYAYRLESNQKAALAMLAWLQQTQPDVILIPNGSILEMGAIYQVARHLNIPTVTYEFGEQRERIWLAYNDEVMLQHTDQIWHRYASLPFDEQKKNKLAQLFQARRHADLWANFSRRWQGLQRQGVEKVRHQLALEDKPTFLLATNVIGDSLTLNRQIFSQSMTEWLERTIEYFAARPQVQLIVRIHPGERYTRGPSVKEIIFRLLPELPSHFRIVEADDLVNTYDLIDLSHLGLVYTTTAGLEMAMSGLPVIVAGQTHYRGKGFTMDPDTWEAYDVLLDRAVQNPSSLRLSAEQIEKAWHYAYIFFFEYPLPFPWHLHLQNDLEIWPLRKVFSNEGWAQFRDSFHKLCGFWEENSKAYSPISSQRMVELEKNIS